MLSAFVRRDGSRDLTLRTVVCLLLAGLTASPRAQAPTFRSLVDLVRVDVAVRDRTGAIVRGLTANDFELLEDGKPQRIESFSFEEVREKAPPVTAPLLTSAGNAGSRQLRASIRNPASPAAAMDTDLAGHRLIVVLFDTSSMQPEDVQTAIDAAVTWVDTRMSDADVVAVAAIGSTLNVLCDFTTNKTSVRNALASLSASDGTAATAIDASTAATDDASTTATDDTTSVDAGTQELDTFNNDVRLRALTTLADALAGVEQKKAILYFSAGMSRNGSDNQVELRRAINAAVKANVAIYPADARGLQAVVPGGSARNGSRGGLGAFSGRQVADQFTQLQAQQETLQTLAADTGGAAFTDTNDLGEAFARATRDISAYYLLGFSSTNPNRDGRFRRITVRLRNGSGYRVDARDGYYADRDFAHTAKADRETLLREQLAAPIPATDIPVFMTSGWFQMSSDKYYVPISVAVPGSAVPTSLERNSLDLAGLIKDERGRTVAQIRDTISVPTTEAGSLAARVLQYGTSVVLPPGRFTAKVAVRENVSGLMGTFEAPLVVPELNRAKVKVSSVVLATQLQPAPPRKTPNPLVRDNLELVPNLSHVVSVDQTLYFYYEVYAPALQDGAAQLDTSLTFYRGKVKVLETPVVERAQLDAPDRHAAIFQLELPKGSLRPGLYTCQINIVDRASGQFTFPRVDLLVR